MLIPLFDYDRHRIIMSTCFTFEGKVYLFFPQGVKYHSLYRTTRKINTFAELEYVAEKFVWLNPDFDLEKMKMLFYILSDRQNGHVIRTYGQPRVEQMVERVHDNQKEPYCHKLRKVIFNPNKMLDRKEKMKIVGMLISRKKRPTEERINEAIQDLWIDKQKITIKSVSEHLDVSRHLIRWFFDEHQLSFIKSMNEEIRKENELSKAITAIDILTEGGNPLKMRELKKITSIRDYSVLKKAISNYQLGV